MCCFGKYSSTKSVVARTRDEREDSCCLKRQIWGFVGVFSLYALLWSIVFGNGSLVAVLIRAHGHLEMRPEFVSESRSM